MDPTRSHGATRGEVVPGAAVLDPTGLHRALGVEEVPHAVDLLPTRGRRAVGEGVGPRAAGLLPTALAGLTGLAALTGELTGLAAGELAVSRRGRRGLAVSRRGGRGLAVAGELAGLASGHLAALAAAAATHAALARAGRGSRGRYRRAIGRERVGRAARKLRARHDHASSVAEHRAEVDAVGPVAKRQRLALGHDGLAAHHATHLAAAHATLIAGALATAAGLGLELRGALGRDASRRIGRSFGRRVGRGSGVLLRHHAAHLAAAHAAHGPKGHVRARRRDLHRPLAGCDHGGVHVGPLVGAAIAHVEGAVARARAAHGDVAGLREDVAVRIDAVAAGEDLDGAAVDVDREVIGDARCSVVGVGRVDAVVGARDVDAAAVDVHGAALDALAGLVHVDGEVSVGHALAADVEHGVGVDAVAVPRGVVTGLVLDGDVVGAAQDVERAGAGLALLAGIAGGADAVLGVADDVERAVAREREGGAILGLDAGALVIRQVAGGIDVLVVVHVLVVGDGGGADQRDRDLGVLLGDDGRGVVAGQRAVVQDQRDARGALLDHDVRVGGRTGDAVGARLADGDGGAGVVRGDVALAVENLGLGDLVALVAADREIGKVDDGGVAVVGGIDGGHGGERTDHGAKGHEACGERGNSCSGLGGFHVGLPWMRNCLCVRQPPALTLASSMSQGP